MIQDLMKAADRHPVIKTLTAAILGLSTALALMTVAGGPVSLAIVGIGALTIAAVKMHGAFKKSSKPFKEMGLEELNTQLIKSHDEVDRLTIAWGKAKAGGGGLFDFGGEEKALLKLLAQEEHRIKIANKYVGLIKDQQKEQELLIKKTALNEEIALRQKNLAIGEEAKKNLIAVIALEEAKKKAMAIHEQIQAHDKYVKARIANEKKITLNHALEQLARTTKAREAAVELAALSHEDASNSLTRLEDEHQRRNEIIFAAYDSQGGNHASWMQRMQAEEVRHHKAVTDLYILRASVIAGLASTTGQALYDVGMVGFDTMKALMVAEATINAYVAASKAWAQGGIFGAVSAGLVLAGAMANVYKIQKMQPPKREFGGPVAGGTPYMVGERGPELFTPNQSGNITSNEGGGNKSVTFNVVANDTAGFDKLLQSRRGLIVGLINQHLNNNGYPSLTTVAKNTAINVR
jgi:hypothetical protein